MGYDARSCFRLVTLSFRESKEVNSKMLKGFLGVVSSPLSPTNNLGSAGAVGNTCTSSCPPGPPGQHCIEVCGGAISKRKLEADLIGRQTT